MSAKTLLNNTPSKTPRKRRAPSEDDEDVSQKNKRVKVQHRSHGKEAGQVLVLGQGDAGQLGLHDDQGEVIKPALVPLPEGIVQVAAGGMHTVCLSEPGSIYTFGCNDEGALGRYTSDDDAPETVPGKVLLEQKVVQVSAGDSHTAALTEDGTVYLWGNFRGANGAIGLLEPMKKCDLPVQVPLKKPVVKISSGVDHLVMVTQDGNLYTAGCGEQGQLGRVKVKDMFTNGKGRQSLNRLQTPQPVKFRGKNVHIVDAFCGDYITFAISKEGHVYGFGLSNYHQLGTQGMKTCYFPVKLACFKNNSKTSWVDFSGGQHHTLCLDAKGKVYSLGRADDGRLGLGLGVKEKKSVVSPTSVAGIMELASGVCCGDSVSFAVTREGSVYAWGFGENHQLGTGSSEDEWTPVKMTGPQLDSLTVLAASSGGQHTVLLAKKTNRRADN